MADENTTTVIINTVPETQTQGVQPLEYPYYYSDFPDQDVAPSVAGFAIPDWIVWVIGGLLVAMILSIAVILIRRATNR